jgi:hypothetical protein
MFLRLRGLFFMAFLLLTPVIRILHGP